MNDSGAPAITGTLLCTCKKVTLKEESDIYNSIERLHILYELLHDEESRNVFKANLSLDMESRLNANRLMAESHSVLPLLGWPQPRIADLKRLNQEQKKIILYGTSEAGQRFAHILESENINFYGFCGRHTERFPDGLLGKPVLSPDELVAHGDEYYVVLCFNTKASYADVSKFLQEHNYPKEHLLDWIDQASLFAEAYFEFPSLYRQGTAFIDAGCYDCTTSHRFAEWCGGAYSSIIAFEPDPVNYAECCRIDQCNPLPNFQLINAGLSSQEGTAMVRVNGQFSYIKSTMSLPPYFYADHSEEVSIRIVTIDNIVGDSTVGFIKVCTPGLEIDVLHGAKNVILRDKPLLALYVTFSRGNLFANMDYLHQLLPEYRFSLRNLGGALVGPKMLYASVDL